MRTTTNALWAVIIMASLTFCLTSCKNSCDRDGDLTRCSDNKIQYCDVQADNFPTWNDAFDCSTYDAVCTAVEWPDNHALASPRSNFSCVTKELSCEGDTAVKCSEDGQRLLVCNYEGDSPVAVISQVNSLDLPFCVEAADGTAGFAYTEGTCVEGEEMCGTLWQRLLCRNGFWNGELSCSEKNNLKCTETIDTEGVNKTECTPAVECTGYTEICAPNISPQGYRRCISADSGSVLYYCDYGTVCNQVSETEIECI